MGPLQGIYLNKKALCDKFSVQAIRTGQLLRLHENHTGLQGSCSHIRTVMSSAPLSNRAKPIAIWFNHSLLHVST